MAENQYATQFESVKVISLGGGWAFVVGRLEDGRVRIAKGKLKPGEVAEGQCPVTQQMKLNVKRLSKWEEIDAEVRRLLAEGD